MVSEPILIETTPDELRFLLMVIPNAPVSGTMRQAMTLSDIARSYLAKLEVHAAGLPDRTISLHRQAGVV